jgi:sulfate transporter 4
VATRLAPCLTWLSKYEPRKQLAPDLLAGIAVAFLIIPQGLSYAGVAGLPAIYGLYTDFLPLFLYFWFGSSMYLQVGAVAVVSLLTNNTVTCVPAQRLALASIPCPLAVVACPHPCAHL